MPGYIDQYNAVIQTDFVKRVAVAIVNHAKTVAVENAGTNEVQSVTIIGAPTGGTFTLTFGGQTTVALQRNADAPTVQAALEALSSVGPGGVRCTGGPLPAAILVEFRAGNAATNVPTMTHTDSLTGGTTPAVVIATTVAGVAGVPNHTNRVALMRQALFDLDASAIRIAKAMPALGADNVATATDNDLLTWVGQMWDAMAGVP